MFPENHSGSTESIVKSAECPKLMNINDLYKNNEELWNDWIGDESGERSGGQWYYLTGPRYVFKTLVKYCDRGIIWDFIAKLLNCCLSHCFQILFMTNRWYIIFWITLNFDTNSSKCFKCPVSVCMLYFRLIYYKIQYWRFCGAFLFALSRVKSILWTIFEEGPASNPHRKESG